MDYSEEFEPGKIRSIVNGGNRRELLELYVNAEYGRKDVIEAIIADKNVKPLTEKEIVEHAKNNQELLKKLAIEGRGHSKLAMQHINSVFDIATIAYNNGGYFKPMVQQNALDIIMSGVKYYNQYPKKFDTLLKNMDFDNSLLPELLVSMKKFKTWEAARDIAEKVWLYTCLPEEDMDTKMVKPHMAIIREGMSQTKMRLREMLK